MPYETIERLQRELTDKYVVVTGDRPELARFEGCVGQVKTVNLSGRALVEFAGFLNNPAWFDIDPACLRVVDKPPEPAPAAKKAAPKKAPAKPSGASAADVLAAARGQAKPGGDATAKTADKAKRVSPSVNQSTADILAAARGAKSAQPSAPEEGKLEGKRTSPSVGLSTADVLAAARGKAPAPSSKETKPRATSSSGMNTEEILAAARAAKKPAAEEAKTSAIDELTATGARGREERRQLSAADIRDIGLGKLSIRREPVVATAPLEKKQPAESEDPHVDALPKKVDHTKLTAADILKMGLRK